jgi:NACHT domain-containing protein
MDKKITINQLPYARAAAFDSQEDEHVSQCLVGTRETLLNEIYEWAINPGKCIYWLQGMAGTGKSTISRTIAQRFHDDRQLGASFFFKRGEAQRGNAQLLFSTIAMDLFRAIPEIRPSIANAVGQDAHISTRRLKEQFDKLILDPLLQLQARPAIPVLVIVLDALDECDRDDDVKVIIGLLSQVKQIKSLQVRIFVTSRPEHPILQSFKEMEDSHREVALHDIPKADIDHDISTFFSENFSRMRREYRYEENWPSVSTIQELVHKASPLFIFAATVCRILSDGVLGDPKDQLERVIEYSDRRGSKLDATYRPVLDRLLLNPDDPSKQRPVPEKAEILEDFRTIVGSIVILNEPLSIPSLSNLLGVKSSKITSKLKWLRAVIRVPEDVKKPVRIFHLSFRDYLLQDSSAEDSPNNKDTKFRIDEKQANEILADRCIQLMSTSLKEDISGVTIPGTLVIDVPSSRVEQSIPSEVQYACVHWVEHLQKSGIQLQDNDNVDQFLRKHLLHWLEALSWIQKMSEGILEIISLESIASVSLLII